MPELPWTKWFPSDWASDPLLSMCDIATQGVWMNAVNAMMLMNSPSITGSLDELSRVCRCRRVQLEAALAELKAKKVGNINQHDGNTTISCRRLLREHNIKELKRKAGLASATKRQHTPQQAEPTQAPTPSAYASASVSASNGKGDEGKGVGEFLRQLGEAFKRPASQPWTYAEQSSALEICRSPEAMAELSIILRWRGQVKPEDRRYLPQSAGRLLASWADVLDRARAGVVVGESAPAKPTLMDKEWNEIMREAERLQ